MNIYAVSGAILFESELNDVVAVVTTAAASRANLSRANLSEANLSEANLSRADLSRAKLPEGIPIFNDPDKQIVAHIEAGGVLEMGQWHTCETTHCRAGWLVTIAGAAGAALEQQFGTNTAAALIYAASGQPQIPDFYASNEDAMADMQKRSAQSNA